jgi:hypothetical protein
MQGMPAQGCCTIDSSSREPVGFKPASVGTRQSLCPAKFSALIWLIQSKMVVTASPPRST